MSKINFKKALLLIICTVFLGVNAYSINTRLIDIPTADTLGANRGAFDLWTNFSGILVRGSYSAVEDLDLAASIRGSHDFLKVYANVKWKFLHQGTGAPSAALGIGNDAIYTVVSYNFNPGFAAHIGLGAGDLATVFAGVDYDLTLGSGAPSVRLLAEINHGLNLGFVAEIAPAFNVKLAIKNLDNLNFGAHVKYVL